MSMYGNSTGTPDSPFPKAPQACLSCRKQKRKCNKALPACALCERMNRQCDYSDASPPPSSDDFNALRMKVVELESRLNGGGGSVNHSTPFTPSSGTLSGIAESLGPPTQAFAPPNDIQWHTVQNRFPAIAFLDSEAFKYGGFAVPKPSVDIPSDVLELLGDGTAVQAILADYFATVHRWLPTVSQKRMCLNMANPLWEAGPDLALLFLAMKLITSRPQDGMESSHNPIYVSAKRFVSLLEASGAASLIVLQANIIITMYEYGQSIYPAAWMSAGWCIRYANLLGINGNPEATQVLGRENSWTEQEERRRTWWAVLIIDKVVSLGGQGYILNGQEPSNSDILPVNDNAWEDGDPSASAAQKLVSSSLSDAASPFPRLCQASVLLGAVFAHHHGPRAATSAKQYESATELYSSISTLARKLVEEAASTTDYLSVAAPLALSFSALCVLCDSYSCPPPAPLLTSEASAMQLRAMDGLKTVALSIVDFTEQITAVTPQPQDLDRVSPMVMDALYVAAANSAWMVRENGDEGSQAALEAIRACLRRLGTRWRNAAEYVRILEAQEFTYAVGSAGS